MYGFVTIRTEAERPLDLCGCSQQLVPDAKIAFLEQQMLDLSLEGDFTVSVVPSTRNLTPVHTAFQDEHTDLSWGVLGCS